MIEEKIPSDKIIKVQDFAVINPALGLKEKGCREDNKEVGERQSWR
jgi:hypothetical protein